MPTRSGWKTPITWFFAPAGLVSGPRMLKMVRTPRSFLTGAACFIAAWWAGANMKPMPSFSIASPVSAGVSAMCAPRASSTSALPEDDDTERPMCFATFAPAAAATNAAHDLAHDVEHLIVEHLAVLNGALDRLGDRDLLHAALPWMKFCSSLWPCSVSS